MNNILKNKLVIDLRSDLITGSGEGWSNVIDTDVVYDQYGFPYIPAKRIKGLLKEACLELFQFGILEDENIISQLFGDEGYEQHHFVIYNAYLDHYEEMKDEIKHISNEYLPYIQKQSVLNKYTSVRYQSAIALKDNEEKGQYEGIALENSLRSSRSIDKGNKFYAYIEYEEEYKDILEKCVKMIHHMGINRTRGFGEVDLSLEDIKNNKQTYSLDLEDDKEYDVCLLLENKTQLSMSATQGEKSLDYIPGASILGYFANRYLKTHEVDATFYDLFIKGKVKFSNAYISDEDWNQYYPVKQSLYKEKVGNRYCDKTLVKELKADDGSVVILSKIRNKFVSDNKYIKEVNKEMFYHHRRPDDKSVGHVINNEDDANGMFYQLEVVSSNQRFISHIRGYGKDLKLVLGGLESHIQIGKSKSTQYGNVCIKDVLVNKVKQEMILKGTEVIVTLKSPLLNLNNYCESNLKLNDLAELLSVENAECFVDYSRVSGFNAKWKLQKPTYMAFSAGSCIRGILKEDMPKHYITGHLTQEGLGEVVYEDVKTLTNADLSKYEANMSVKEPYYLRGVIAESLKNQLYLDSLNAISKINVSKIISATLNGRLLKMLEKPTWDLFLKDVDGIANKEKKEEVNNVISKVVACCDELLRNRDAMKFVQDDYRYEFYKQTCINLLVRNKIEGREV